MPFSPILNAKELLPWQIYVLITDELCYINNNTEVILLF